MAITSTGPTAVYLADADTGALCFAWGELITLKAQGGSVIAAPVMVPSSSAELTWTAAITANGACRVTDSQGPEGRAACVHIAPSERVDIVPLFDRIYQRPGATLDTTGGTPWHILPQGSTHADLDSVVFYDTVLTLAEMDDHRCALTTITGTGDGGPNPCSGQSLGQVVFNPGFIDAYLFDSPDAGPGASYTGTRDFTPIGSVTHTSSPLP